MTLKFTKSESPKKPPLQPKRLDDIDWKILRYLQEVDSRASNMQLAFHAGLSPPPCLRRVKSLQERGVIRGFHVDINPEMLGYGVSMLLHVRLKEPSLEKIEQFEEEILAHPMIRQCDVVSGEDGEDFLLRVVARSMDECTYLIEQLRRVENVESIRKTLMIRRSKTLFGAPMEPRALPSAENERTSSSEPRHKSRAKVKSNEQGKGFE